MTGSACWGAENFFSDNPEKPIDVNDDVLERLKTKPINPHPLRVPHNLPKQYVGELDILDVEIIVDEGPDDPGEAKEYGE